MCGACTVHMDGRAIRSCITPLRHVADAAVTTIEGLDPKGQHPLQKAWTETAGAAMRLLSVRTDHAGRITAEGLPRPERQGHRRRHERQSVQLHGLRPHPPSDRAAAAEMREAHMDEVLAGSEVEQNLVSRRSFLIGAAGTSVLFGFPRPGFTAADAASIPLRAAICSSQRSGTASIAAASSPSQSSGPRWASTSARPLRAS